MKVVTFFKNGKRYDAPLEKGWITIHGHPVYIPEENEREDLKRLDRNQQKDYLDHRRAGTPHEFAMGLAEKKPK
jgi:hypothetical protein